MRKAVEQNGGMAVGGMLGFDTCIRSSCTSTIEMGWSNSILQPQVLLERPFSPPKPLAQLPRERGRQLGLQPVCEPKRRSSDQLHDRRSGYRLAGLRTPQAGPSISVTVLRDWIAPSYTLTAGATLYGYVLAASGSKSSGDSQLALVFDHGDCSGHPKQELRLGSSALLEAIHSIREFIMPRRRKSRTERGQS